jgi:hypothetical protein
MRIGIISTRLNGTDGVPLELVTRLDLPSNRLFIMHRAHDEGLEYWHWLKREAGVMGVDLRMIDHLVGAECTNANEFSFLRRSPVSRQRSIFYGRS